MKASEYICFHCKRRHGLCKGWTYDQVGRFWWVWLCEEQDCIRNRPRMKYSVV